MLEYVVAYSVGAVLLVLSGIFLIKPIKLAFRVMLKCMGGFFLILFFNLFSEFCGITIGVNLVTAVTAGVLGLPGLTLMIALKSIL